MMARQKRVAEGGNVPPEASVLSLLDASQCGQATVCTMSVGFGDGSAIDANAALAALSDSLVFWLCQMASQFPNKAEAAHTIAV